MVHNAGDGAVLSADAGGLSSYLLGGFETDAQAAVLSSTALTARDANLSSFGEICHFEPNIGHVIYVDLMSFSNGGDLGG